MKLYTTDLSPNCRRVEATIHHLGMAGDIEFEKVDFTSGVLQSADYRAINPNGKVPVLVHEDRVMWESNAIMHYLSDEAGDARFFPTDHKQRADIVRWQFWESLHFNRAVGRICWETLAKPALGLGTADEEIVKEAQGEFHRFAEVLNSHLNDRDYVMGGGLTLADFAVGSHSAFVLNAESQVPIDGYPAVKKWFLTLEDCPSWAKTRPGFGGE